MAASASIQCCDFPGMKLSADWSESHLTSKPSCHAAARIYLSRQVREFNDLYLK